MPPAKTSSVVAAAAAAAAAILIVARLRRRRRAPPSGLSSRPAKPDDYATLCALDAIPPTHGGHSLFDVRLTRASREGVQKVLVLCEGGGEALAWGTVLLEPKFLRGGSCVAHLHLGAGGSAARRHALLARLCAVAQRAGCYKAILDAPPFKADELAAAAGMRATQQTMRRALPSTVPPAPVGPFALGGPAAAAANTAHVARAAAASEPVQHLVEFAPQLLGPPGSALGGMRLRALRASDGPAAFLALLAQLSVAPHINAADFAARVEAARDAPTRAVLVVERVADGTLLGCATLAIERRPLAPKGAGVGGRLEDVVIDAAARGTGLGRALVDAVAALAARCLCAELTLNCKPHNAPFYEKLGFEWSAACFAVYFDNNETPVIERRGTPGGV